MAKKGEDEELEERRRRPYNTLAYKGWNQFSSFLALSSSKKTSNSSKRLMKNELSSDFLEDEASISTFEEDDFDREDNEEATESNISSFTQNIEAVDRVEIEDVVELSQEAISEDLFDCDEESLSQKISSLNSSSESVFDIQMKESSSSVVISSVSPTQTTIETPLKGSVWFESIRKRIPDLNYGDDEDDETMKTIKPIKGGFAEQLEKMVKRRRDVATAGVTKTQTLKSLSVILTELLSDFGPFVFVCRPLEENEEEQSHRSTSYERLGLLLPRKAVHRHSLRVGCVVCVKYSSPLYPIPSLRMSIIFAPSIVSVDFNSHQTVSNISLVRFRCDCEPDLNACHFWLNELRRPCFGSFVEDDDSSTDVAELLNI